MVLRLQMPICYQVQYSLSQLVVLLAPHQDSVTLLLLLITNNILDFLKVLCLLMEWIVVRMHLTIHSYPTGHLISQHLQVGLGLIFGFRYIGNVMEIQVHGIALNLVLLKIYTIEVMSTSCFIAISWPNRFYSFLMY